MVKLDGNRRRTCSGFFFATEDEVDDALSTEAIDKLAPPPEAIVGEELVKKADVDPSDTVRTKVNALL